MSKTTNAQYVKMFRTNDFSMVESFARDFAISEAAALEIAEYVAEKGKKSNLRIRRRNDMPFDKICVFYSDSSYSMHFTTGRHFLVKNGEIVSRTI